MPGYHVQCVDCKGTLLNDDTICRATPPEKLVLLNAAHTFRSHEILDYYVTKIGWVQTDPIFHLYRCPTCEDFGVDK